VAGCGRGKGGGLRCVVTDCGSKVRGPKFRVRSGKEVEVTAIYIRGGAKKLPDSFKNTEQDGGIGGDVSEGTNHSA